MKLDVLIEAHPIQYAEFNVILKPQWQMPPIILISNAYILQKSPIVLSN